MLSKFSSCIIFRKISILEGVKNTPFSHPCRQTFITIECSLCIRSYYFLQVKNNYKMIFQLYYTLLRDVQGIPTLGKVRDVMTHDRKFFPMGCQGVNLVHL